MTPVEYGGRSTDPGPVVDFLTLTRRLFASLPLRDPRRPALDSIRRAAWETGRVGRQEYDYALAVALEFMPLRQAPPEPPRIGVLSPARLDSLARACVDAVLAAHAERAHVVVCWRDDLPFRRWHRNTFAELCAAAVVVEPVVGWIEQDEQHRDALAFARLARPLRVIREERSARARALSAAESFRLRGELQLPGGDNSLLPLTIEGEYHVENPDRLVAW